MRTFTVSGKVPFPLDMLRYDACWPMTGEDATSMQYSIDRVKVEGKTPQRRITLTTSNLSAPTEARWNSFLWRVVES